MHHSNFLKQILLLLTGISSFILSAQNHFPSTKFQQDLTTNTIKLQKINTDSAHNYLRKKLPEANQLNDFESTRYILIQLFDYCRIERAYDQFPALKNSCIEIFGSSQKDTTLCHYMEGLIQSKKGEKETGELILRVVEKSAKVQNDASLLIYTNLELAEIEKTKKNLESATERYLEALKYAEVINDTLSIININRKLSVEFLIIKDFERALRYVEKAASYLSSDNKRGFLFVKILEAGIYLDKEQPEKAAPILESLIKVSKDTKNWDIHANANYMYARIKVYNEEYEEAKKLAQAAVDYEQRPVYRFGYMLRLSEAYEWSGNCPKAADILMDAKQYISPQLPQTNILYLYQKLITCDACAGRTDSITVYMERLADLQFELRTRKDRQQALEVESKFRNQIQADSIALLSLENQKQKVEIIQRNTLLISGGIISILLGILLFIFQKRNNFLQENEAQKSKLFANIAHELQTPLTLIKGFSQKIIRQATTQSEVSQMAELIHKNTNTLIDTTNQIFSLSKIDKVLEQVNFASIHLAEFGDYLQQEFHPLVQDKSIDFQVHFDNSTLITDPEKIITIFKNLITNALKHTPKAGKIIIEFEEGQQSYQFEVSDSGTGIPKEELPKIFDRFYQSKNKKPEGGFGIGLAICKEYINLLGGTIKVESQPENGSTFQIEIPKKEVFKQPVENYHFLSKAAIDLSEQTSIKPISASPNPEILIVEDNKDVCLYLDLILKQDYHLKFVHDGSLALTYLETHIPKLIITDWMMPNIDGYELTERLKSRPEYQAIPVLMLTARRLPTDNLKALRVGVDDYIVKPFEEEELQKRVSALLNVREQRPGPFVNDFQHQIDELDANENTEWLIQLENTILSMLSDVNLNTEKVIEKLDSSLFIVNRRLNHLIGLNLGSYIREIRFWEARRMLETKEYYSVKAVALSVGFKNTKYFARKFKERFGKYPSDYLRN